MSEAKCPITIVEFCKRVHAHCLQLRERLPDNVPDEYDEAAPPLHAVAEYLSRSAGVRMDDAYAYIDRTSRGCMWGGYTKVSGEVLRDITETAYRIRSWADAHMPELLSEFWSKYGWAAREMSLPGRPKRKRGGQRREDPVRDKRLADEWEASGLKQAEFERERGMPPGSVRKAKDRLRK